MYLNSTCKFYLLTILIGTLCACGDEEPEMVDIPPVSTANIFKNDTKVSINGYDGSAMEPFISRDDQYLFFNNSEKETNDSNLHFAKKVTDTSFDYMGEIPGANTTSLEGGPTMDQNGNFYFTSLRSYATGFGSLYGGTFDGTELTTVGAIDQSLNVRMERIVNFDSEVSADGQTLYYATGKFSGNELPDESNLQIATMNDRFRRIKDSDDLMININSELSQYAAAISNDELELFYTRALMNIEDIQIKILTATRESKNEPFGQPEAISSIIGIQTEAPSISSDAKRLYYHKNEGGFVIYMVSRD